MEYKGKKTINVVYVKKDVLICILSCVLCVSIIVLGIYLFSTNEEDWMKKHILFDIVFFIALFYPFISTMFIDRVAIYFGNYVSFGGSKGLKKTADEIDSKWHNYAKIDEIENVEVVTLTEEEIEEKNCSKHKKNVYLKVILKDGKIKYPYVGWYSDAQIQRILAFLPKKTRR